MRRVTFPWGRVVLARSRLPIVAVFLWALAAPVSTSAVTLNPPPPDFETCHGQGNHTICHGRQVFPVGGDPTGIFCGSGSDSFEIVDHPGLLIQEATRWYDADGNLVARKIHEVWLRSEWMNPVTGTTVSYRQAVTYSDEFVGPGRPRVRGRDHDRRRQLHRPRPRSDRPKRRPDGVLVRWHARVPSRPAGVRRLFRRRRSRRPPANLRRPGQLDPEPWIQRYANSTPGPQ